MYSVVFIENDVGSAIDLVRKDAIFPMNVPFDSSIYLLVIIQ